MKAISLWQPWASAIAVGVKRYETRSWTTQVRGQVAIHAAKKRSPNQRAIFEGWLEDHLPIRFAFEDGLELDFDSMPFGAIVAVATIDDVQYSGRLLPDLSEAEIALGDHGPGRFCWMLKDIRRLTRAIDCVGRQGFFNLPPDVEAKVTEQL